MEGADIIKLALIQIAVFGFSMGFTALFYTKADIPLRTYLSLTLAFVIMFTITLRYDLGMIGYLFRDLIRKKPKNNYPDYTSL